MLTVSKQTIEPAQLKFFFHSRKKKAAELLTVYKQALCLTPTWRKTKFMKSNMKKAMTYYQHATVIIDMTDYHNKMDVLIVYGKQAHKTWPEYLSTWT